MKISGKKIFFLMISIYFFCLNISSANALAVGISPNQISAPGILKDSKIEKSFTLSNPPENNLNILNYKLEVTGSGAKYIRIANNIISVPASKTGQKVNFSIEPIGAEDGSYEAQITAHPVSINSGASANSDFAVNIGIGIKISFSVVSQINRDLELKSISIQQAKSNLKSKTDLTKAKVNLYILNNGNIKEKASNLILNYIPKNNSESGFKETVKLDKNIEPFTGLQINELETSLKLPPGAYSVKAQLYGDSGLLDEVKKDYNIIYYMPLKKDNFITAYIKKFFSLF